VLLAGAQANVYASKSDPTLSEVGAARDKLAAHARSAHARKTASADRAEHLGWTLGYDMVPPVAPAQYADAERVAFDRGYQSGQAMKVNRTMQDTKPRLDRVPLFSRSDEVSARRARATPRLLSLSGHHIQGEYRGEGLPSRHYD
jgi:hypothetical protein